MPDGVFPVHNNIFKINTLGRTTPETFVVIKDMETFEPGIASKTEEWTPMDTAGWVRRAVTGKGLAVKLKGKRNYGDVGNDYIAEKLLSVGSDTESILEWTLPNGDKLVMACVIDLKQSAGGDSTKIDTLEFDLLSDGLPEYTPSAGGLGELTFVTEDGSIAGTTKIAAVVPILTGGNAYYYKVNGAIPVMNEVLSVANGWATYALGADIPVTNGNSITLVETAAGIISKKAGSSVAIVV
jgi:hypothetical protein